MSSSAGWWCGSGSGRGGVPGRIPEPAGRPVPARRGRGCRSRGNGSDRRGAGSAAIPLVAFVGIAGWGGICLSRTVGGRTTTTLILAGVAVAAFATAVQTFLLQRNYETLREGVLLDPGATGHRWLGRGGRLVPCALAAGTVLIVMRRLLDVLGLGDEEAAGLGVDVVMVRRLVVLAATLATAAAVSVSGLIAFVGIIVPHTHPPAHGLELPGDHSAFPGLRRFVPHPRRLGRPNGSCAGELPIGVVTAFLGAPFFLSGSAVDERILMISWRDVVVSFNGVTVVGSVTLTVGDGEWVG